MIVRLDKNEMPSSPPKEILDHVKKCIEDINRYTPQNYVDQLVNLLSNYANVPKEFIFLTFGSDVLIKEFIFLFARKRQIIIADPTFYLIANAAQKTNSPLLKVRLKEPGYNLNLEPLNDELKKPTLIIIDNPNNPTGNLLLNEKDIKMLLENENVIVLIDEAYFEFSKLSFVHLTDKYPNLAIARTLSKSFGLAGSGIGYLIGGTLIQKEFSGLDVMLPYPSVIAGIQALTHKEYMINFIKDVAREKARVSKMLKDMGIQIYPSYTNFLLMKTKIYNLANKLAEKSIFISNLSNYSLTSEFCRVTIGNQTENDKFLKEMSELVELNRIS